MIERQHNFQQKYSPTESIFTGTQGVRSNKTYEGISIYVQSGQQVIRDMHEKDIHCNSLIIYIIKEFVIISFAQVSV